jgi:hypothetical protein
MRSQKEVESTELHAIVEIMSNDNIAGQPIMQIVRSIVEAQN